MSKCTTFDGLNLPLISILLVMNILFSSNYLRSIVFLFAVALYINTTGNKYAFDDSAVMVHARQGLKDIPTLLTNDLFSPIYGQPLDIGIRWRPLLLFTAALEYQLFGENPFMGHIINIILYGIAAMMLLMLLLRMLPKQPLAAFIATLLFVAHPIHTEVVANIKSRDEILSFLFLTFTLISLHRFTLSDKRKHFLSGCLFYILALLTKENGITFLAVIPLFLFCFTDKNKKHILLLTAPFLALVIIYLSVRASLFSGFVIGDMNMDMLENQFYGAPLLQKFATISFIMGKYLLLLFFPHPLACDYSYNQIPIINWLNPKAFIPALLLGGLIIYAVKNIRRKFIPDSPILPFSRSPVQNRRNGEGEKRRGGETGIGYILAFCILFYFITISIVSNIFFNIGAPMAERFLFLPSLGFCLAITVILLRMVKITNRHELKFPHSLYIPLGIILSAFSYKTIERNGDWKDNFTLWAKDAQSVPNSAKIHYYYGGEWSSRYPNGHPEKTASLRKALSEEQRAIAIYPKFYVAAYTIGLIYEKLQMTDSAISYFHKSAAIEPRYAESNSKLGFYYGNIKNQPDTAIFYYHQALQSKPNNALWGLQLGVVYGMKGMYEDAIKIFKHVKEMDPQRINECNLNLGTAYFLSKNYNEALKYFQQLLQIAPQDVTVLQKIGETYQAMEIP